MSQTTTNRAISSRKFIPEHPSSLPVFSGVDFFSLIIFYCTYRQTTIYIQNTSLKIIDRAASTPNFKCLLSVFCFDVINSCV
jgi:hypothetical protein